MNKRSYKHFLCVSLVTFICAHGAAQETKKQFAANGQGQVPTSAQQKPSIGQTNGTNLPKSAGQNVTPPQDTGSGPAPTSERALAILNSTTWAIPLYRTATPQVKEITQIDHYSYTEQLFQPAYVVEATNQNGRISPEQTLLSFVSNMMRLDYAAWLTYWDGPSRKEQLKSAPELQKTEWRDLFANYRIVLVRKVSMGPYAILTYHLKPEVAGTQAPAFEFPTIFRQTDGVWYATQDLAKDPILAISPWASGEVRKEVYPHPFEESMAASKLKTVGQ